MQNLEPFDSCYVIHSRGYKENSLLIDFFSLNHGRVSAIAKSSKSKKNLIKGLLQPFIPLNITLKKGYGDLFYVSDFYALETYKLIELPNMFCATYLNELLYYLFKSKESEPTLFAKYIETLNFLRLNQNVEIALRDFEFTLFESLGYGITYRQIGGNKIKDNDYYIYLDKTGFKATSNEIDSFAGYHLNKIENKDYSDPQTRKTAKYLSQTIIKSLLGNRKIKSKDMYCEYLKLMGK